MKKLEISISKAQLTGFSIELEEGKPSVRATIGLFTEGGKKITDYSIQTHSWNEESKFELPVDALPAIREVANILERVVVKHCRDNQKAISTGEIVE